LASLSRHSSIGTDIAICFEKNIENQNLHGIRIMQRNCQFGFTMFEIGSATAIICLLATIMLMGREFTINSQVKRLERDFRSIQTAVYDLRDGLRLKQGDVRKVSLHLQDAAAPSNNGNLDASLDVNWNSTSGVPFKLWKKVRSGTLAQGSMDTNLQVPVPLKLPGGFIGVSGTDSAIIAGLNGDYIICTNNIAGKLAKELDLVMDDGNTASGLMMVSNSVGGAGIAKDSIADGARYLVCLGV
jgi:hypothetical protein